jgi:hypothetical protein
MARAKKLTERLGQWCGASSYGRSSRALTPSHLWFVMLRVSLLTEGPCIGACNADFARRAYETDDSVFLYILRVEFPSLWEMAFEPGWLIVVPQGVSLSSEVSLDDVETHIVR